MTVLKGHQAPVLCMDWSALAVVSGIYYYIYTRVTRVTRFIRVIRAIRAIRVIIEASVYTHCHLSQRH